MEAARHPFPVSSTAPHYRRTKSESQGVSELSGEPLSGNATYRELTHKAVFGRAVLNALIGYLKRAVSGFGPIIELSTFFHPLHLDAVQFHLD